MDRENNLPDENKENLVRSFNGVVESYMEKYKISQGSACVMRGEETIFEKGFGVEKDTIFRLASITKYFTRVGIMKLVGEGKINLDTPVFPLLSLTPLPGEQYNTELNSITVKNLIDHQGGWDAQITGEITFQRPVVAKAVGKVESEVTPKDMVRYMISKPLQFEPGAKKAYSGFGYSVLGRIIEKVSGLAYGDYIKQELTKPLGLHSIQLGHTGKEHTLPNEAHYERDSGTNSTEDPYTFLCLEMADSAGGLISNASDVCKFLNHYWGNGLPRTEQTGHYFYMNGRSVGTLNLAVQTREGINYVILFNNRHNRDNQKDEELRINADKALEEAPEK